MDKLFVGISNAYPSTERPYDLIFVHRWFKQIEPYFDRVIVISRIKVNPLTANTRRIRRSKQAKSIESDYYDGIQVFRIRTVNILPENYLPFNGLIAYRRIKKTITQVLNGYSEARVHIATWGDFSFVSALILKQMGVQYFASAIGNYENQYYNKQWNVNNWILKYIYKNSRFVLCVSNDLERKVRSISNKINTFVFYSGVDMNIFCRINLGKEILLQKWHLENDVFYFVFIGRICRQKGIHELLNAFTLYNSGKERIQLLLVGQLKDRILRQRIESTRNCKWIPPAGEEAINELLNIADIFIFPSWSEGTPNSLLEAMAVGLPVITTSVGGIPDIIEDGYNGVLIKPKSDEELVTSFSTLFENESLRKKLGCNAKLSIREKFDYSRNASALINKLDINDKI